MEKRRRTFLCLELMSGLKKIGDTAKEYIGFWPLALACVYVAGFAVWNRFLTNFGLFEFNLLRTQFISAGILAVVCFYFYLRFIFITRTLDWRYFRYALVFTYWIYLFPLIIFPLVPQWIGGGKPIITSLVGTSTQIMYLEDSFQIPSEPNSEGKKPPIQTRPACLFFARENRSVIGPATGTVGRIVALPDDQFIGFSRPASGYSMLAVLPCFQYLRPYSHFRWIIL